jgi:UDPglucose--hexose-1-phosphate uridylyltransferase
MNVLRFDHTTADWVVYAPLRKLRPHHDKASIVRGPDALRDTKEFCPFCPGNEKMTPPEICAVRADGSTGTSDWKVRVIPNKFPALRIEEDHKRHEDDGATFQWMGGCGAHEVVIESPEHTFYLGKNPVEQIELVLKALLARYLDLKRDKRFQSVIIFKNHGEAAGTSIRHPHCQIIATPAAHLPFETWILPRRAQASWDSLQTAQIRPLAEILKTMPGRPRFQFRHRHGAPRR